MTEHFISLMRAVFTITVLTLLQHTSAATRSKRGMCADGIAESNPLTISLHNARCDSTPEEQASEDLLSCEKKDDASEELDFFHVKGESTEYVASSFTITEDATVYVDEDGDFEIVQEEEIWCVHS